MKTQLDLNDICNAILDLEYCDLSRCEVLCRTVKEKSGVSNWDHVQRKLNKERVDPDREKRKQPSPGKKQKMYDWQKGVCACGCGEMLLIPARNNHADHFNPHEKEDFNGIRNMRLLLPQHNLEKSSKGPIQVSKEGSGTVVEQIQRGSTVEDDLRNEP